MATTSFQGIVRSYGGQDKSSGVTPGVLLLSEVISFNAAAAAVDLTPVRIGTSATAGSTFVLPAGAIPVSFSVIIASTGASSTVDIGTTADVDGFFNEVASVTKGTLKGADGALVTAVGITANATVAASVGATAGTGTVTGVFTYTVVDNARAGESQPELV
jgi:hypothetical protein